MANDEYVEPPGGYGEPVPGAGDSNGDGPTDPPPSTLDMKRWWPAFALGAVLLIILTILIMQVVGGDDDESAETTTSSSSTSLTTTSSSSTSTSTSTSTSAAPTTAAPTTAPPTTAPPTTAAPTTTGQYTQLIADCLSGEEIACYTVGSEGLPPPGNFGDSNQWAQASDADVVEGCIAGDGPACYEAGVRHLDISD